MNTIDVTNTFVPNWFEKEHIEKFIGRSLTDYEWRNFLDTHQHSLMNWMSEQVSDFVNTEVDWDELKEVEE